MTAPKQQPPSAKAVGSGGEMTIYTAAGQYSGLRQRLEEGKPLELDLSGVTEMDSAGVQVLMMLKKGIDESGGELHLVGHSRPVVEIFELLDLQSHFGDPVLIPAEWGEA
jgi:anti-anti-sigma factor